MKAAVESVQGGKGLQEALYNIPAGPPKVLTKSEEDEIVQYLIQMADMGYGLTREAVMHMVYICR